MSTSPFAAAASEAGGVEARARRARSPRLGVTGPAFVERDPPGEEARGEPEIERAVHVGAPQRGEEARAGDAGERGRGAHDGIGGLGQRLATEHHDHITFAAVERRGGALDLTVTRRGAVAASARASWAAIVPASPGACRSTADASRVSPIARGAISMIGTPRSTAA